MVCSFFDPQKYVLGPYTKHAFKGDTNRTKIDSELLQKIPEARAYDNSIVRSVKTAVIGTSSKNSTELNENACANECSNDVAWTYNTTSDVCKCSAEVPPSSLGKTDTLSGGTVQPDSEMSAIRKIAFLDDELVKTQFAETPLVCCSYCLSDSAGFYVSDGFSCKCYSPTKSEI